MIRRRTVLGFAAAVALPAWAEPPPPSAVVSHALEQRIDGLARSFDGRVGIAVEDVKTQAVVAWQGRRYFPQQSVSKLWVALAVLDQVDRGRLSLEEPIRVTRADMSVFNQPIQKLLGEDGYAATLGGLLGLAISHSDNAANDIIIRRLGGPAAVAAVIAAKALPGIRASPEEHILESRIAGLAWRQEYSFGQAFWTARDQVDPRVRLRKLQRYVDHPEDGATPKGIVRALGRLQRGELLSPASTERLIGLLTATETGPLRLKAGLGPGWSIAHKTGTGQDLGDLTTGYNDVGLITAPNGDAYAIAVMIGETRRPVPERQALMAAVSRAVVEAHDGSVP
jgi:beta-lactamase class A